MTRTKELQSIIHNRITACGYTAYADEAPRNAGTDPVYPYVIYSIGSFSFTDIRDDIILDVDIWDESPSYERIEAMADAIEAAIPGTVYSESASVIPQFFRYLRSKVPDPDKKLKRINLKFEIQNYPQISHERGGN